MRMALASLPRREHAIFLRLLELRLEAPRLGAVELRLIMRMLAAGDLRCGRCRLIAGALGFLPTRRAKRRRRDAAENVEQRAPLAAASRFRFRRRGLGLWGRR